METVYKRTILDLYKPLLKSFKGKHTLYICKAIMINRMGFTSLQKLKLKEHFLTQFPSETQYSEFYINPLFNKTDDERDGWFMYDRLTNDRVSVFSDLVKTESFSLRVNLLEKIIENLEKNPELNLEL